MLANAGKNIHDGVVLRNMLTISLGCAIGMSGKSTGLAYCQVPLVVQLQ